MSSKIHIKKTKSRMRLLVASVLATICVAVLIFSGYQLICWLIDTKNINEELGNIEQKVSIMEVDDDENTQTAEDSNKDSLYWKYLNTKLIDVDFSELIAQNPDTKGWLQVSGTNINYPFVQTSNNDYYLKNSFERVPNNGGWVFADFRNHLDGSDRNMIIYAHGRYDGAMFGSLKNILTSGWLNNADNFTVRTSTEHVNALWQVFSVYRIPLTSDYIQTSFSSDSEYLSFLQMLQGRSAHNFNVGLSENDKILTLSTCFNDDRVVLHARLIKWVEK